MMLRLEFTFAPALVLQPLDRHKACKYLQHLGFRRQCCASTHRRNKHIHTFRYTLNHSCQYFWYTDYECLRLPQVQWPKLREIFWNDGGLMPRMTRTSRGHTTAHRTMTPSESSSFRWPSRSVLLRHRRSIGRWAVPKVGFLEGAVRFQ